MQLLRKYSLYLIPFLLASILFAVSFTPLIQNPLRQLADFKFRQFPLNPPPDDDIMLLVIDDSSLKFFQDNGVSYPWPRLFYGKVVEFLQQAGARAIFFDLIFNERDLNREEIDATTSDASFAAALSQMDNVYLASQLIDDRRFQQEISTSLQLEGQLAHLSNYPGLITPIEPFQAVSKTGFINIFPDSDGVIRSAKLLARSDQQVIPSLILQMYADLQQKYNLQLEKSALKFSDLSIPTDRKGNYQISWYQKGDFEYIPFKAVMQSASAGEFGNPQTLANEIFEDKVIFIGATASGLKDIRAVPIDENIPGVEIWASLYSNLAQQHFQKTIAPYWNFILLLFTTLLIFLLSHLRKKYLSYLAISLFLVLLVIADLLSWIFGRLQIDIISLLASAIISFIIIQIIQYTAEVKHKNKLKKTFGRYLNPNLVEYLAANDSELKMGGRESQVSVLFSDIYDFTTISETMQPSEIVATLNEYFDDLTRMILQNDGLLDKYTGDGIMAVFGSPLPDAEHARKACKALMEHKAFCANLQKKSQLSFSEKIHLNTRLAINSGVAITGNIGSSKRMDFTAIGDTVNLAARLEAVNKLYGTNYLISEATYKLVQEFFEVRFLDMVMVKGRSGATIIYELLGCKGCAIDEVIDYYEQAWQLYADRKWQEARNILINFTTDPPSKKLLERIDSLLLENPTNWSPIRKLYAK
ncbi:MAG: adenylate/guanylate cyclase domain-containing protein [Candidatus Cloacimonadales bacterium]